MCPILLSGEYYYDVICVLMSQKMSAQVKRLFLRELSDVGLQLSLLLFYVMCYHLEDNLFLESLLHPNTSFHVEYFAFSGNVHLVIITS